LTREVVVTGASGFLGRELCKQLHQADWSIVGLSTDPARAARSPAAGVRWLALDSAEAAAEITRIGKVINLAGAHPFARRWTGAYKELIVASRIGTTRRVVAALASSGASDKVLLNASGVWYYGDCGDEMVRDDRGPGRSWFLSDMISTWEAAARTAEAGGARVALMRIGIALERDGGALPIVEQSFARHMGGHVGSGRQYVAWLHNRDCAAMFVRALEDPAWKGGIILAAPNPVTFAELARAIGARLRRRSWFHPPRWMARALIGEASAILLESQRAQPERALAHGFSFRHPTLDSAFDAIYT
jgi:uncharacterized protein (TIGR01777 family)